MLCTSHASILISNHRDRLDCLLRWRLTENEADAAYQAANGFARNALRDISLIRQTAIHSLQAYIFILRGKMAIYTVGIQATRLLDFYLPFFRTRSDAHNFLIFCVGKYINPDIDDAPLFYVHSLAHRLVLQPHTVVSLADSIKDSDYLKLVLLMTLAESTSKMWFESHMGGQSKKYCIKFFQDLCASVPCRSLLLEIINADNLDNAVNSLYKIRCDAIHEGWLHPWNSFSNGKHFLISKWASEIFNLPQVYSQSEFIYDVLRHIVVNGCIETIIKSFDKDCYIAECPGHNGPWNSICENGVCDFLVPKRN